MSRLAAAHALGKAPEEDSSGAFLRIDTSAFERSIDEVDFSSEGSPCQADELSFEESIDQADRLVFEPAPAASRINEVLLCGDDCVRCGACFGDAGDACAFEGASVAGPCPDMSEGSFDKKREFGEASCGSGVSRGGHVSCGTMLDEESLAAEVAEIFERRGFPAYAARFAAQAAVEAACEMWHPCRTDGGAADE